MKSIPYCPIKRKRRHTISKPKSEWKKFRPNRYLYHLSYGGDFYTDKESLLLKRLGFATEGICGIEKGLGGVWANNQMRKVADLWPICFDIIDCWTKEESLKLFYEFDIWRIDTTVINNVWYLDPNLIDDPYSRNGEARDYLYCENTVHPRALKLFTLSVNDYRYLYEDGNIDEFKLNPVDKINDFIDFKWRE
jgi:hypothetical protein